MLHRIVKIVSSYVSSVCERKHLELDPQNYTVEITVTARQANHANLVEPELISVTNHINVVNGLPHTYSEIVRNAVGQTINFVAGASSNKRKMEQDKLIASFAEAKSALAESEIAKVIAPSPETTKAVIDKMVSDEANIQARLDAVSIPDASLEEPVKQEPTIVKAKKPRSKKSEKVETNEPQTA